MDSAQFKNDKGDVSVCKTRATTELEIGIDEEAGEYGITVWAPGCYGATTYHYGKIEKFGLVDETGIVINKQTLGSDHNKLSGTLTEQATDALGGKTITTYKWNLKKTKN